MFVYSKWVVFVNIFALVCLVESTFGLGVVIRSIGNGEECPSYKHWLYGSSITSMIIVFPLIVGYDVMHWYLCLKEEGNDDGVVRWTMMAPFFLIFCIYLVMAAITVYNGIRIMIPCSISGDLVVGIIQCTLYVSVFVVTALRSIYLYIDSR
jgi:hypothetical protein